MKSHLKVKVFSLTNEMTYIRRQEEKWKSKARAARQKVVDFAKASNGAVHVQAQASVEYCEANFWSQRGHRENLKNDARHTHLAYGCMRGTPYQRIETISYGPMKGYGSYEPRWEDISAMIERFAKDEPNQQELNQRAAEWITDAKVWYEGNEARIKQMWKLRETQRASAEWAASWEAAKAKANAWRESMGYPTK